MLVRKNVVAEERESLTEKRKMRTDQYEPQAAMQLLAEHRVNPRAQLIE
jgi:membrane protein insertase Oxa1/YidC/SpoIIIJ